MADQQQDPKIVQQLIDLYQKVDRLTRSQAENMARISAEAGNTTKQINRLQSELISTENSFSSIAGILKSSVQEFSKYNTTASNTKKSFSSLQSISSKLLSDQSGFSRLSEKELIKLKEKLTLEAQNLESNLNSKDLTEEQQKEVNNVFELTKELNTLLKKRLDNEKEITKAVGVTGNALKGLSKIPGIGSMLKTEEAIEEMKELADTMQAQGKNVNSFSNKLKLASTGLKTAAGGIKAALTDPVTILTFIVTKALEANRQVVEMGKSLGYGGDRAEEFRENMVGIARNSSNINVTAASLTEAFSELVQATGFAYEFTADQLETQVKLTKQIGLQADEAAQIQRFAVLNGKTSEETYKSFVKGLATTRNQLKVGINFKAALAEAVKVSGQLAANLGNNPETIAKAVVTAKAFGMTLEQVAKSGESLLNFESSIENELKAELLTGKELNLERARAAALAGDQITLAEELNKNIGSSAEFTKMNVLQQKALAESVGMTADELANTLRKREEAIASGKSLAQITADEAAEALERQNIQDKFNAAILKLQDIIGNLVAGPVGELLDIFSNILGFVSGILGKWYILYPLLGIVALSYIPKMAAGFTSMGKSIAGMAKNFTSMFSKEGPASTITSSRGLTLTKKATGSGVDKAKEAAEKATGAGDKAGAGGPGAGEGIKGTLKGISAGISSFSKVKATDILKLAGSALALVALTPAIPALLLLQLVNGKLIQGALTGLGKGLAALGNALSKPQVMLGVGVFTLAMMGLGKALGYVAPAIEAFGKAIKSTFEGIGTIITAAATGIATIFDSLQNVDVMKLLAIGPALVGIGVGLAALGGGGILGAIGAFLSGDPIEKLQGLAASGDGLTKTATALQAIAGALAGVSVALAAMDISKLEALDEFSSNQASNAIVNGITSFITGPIKSTGNKEEINTGINLTPMIAAINEVTAAVNKLYSKDTAINMDGKKVGTTLVQNSYKAA
jgi:hypothetical protein